MPHTTIEYSSNIAGSFDARRYGQLLHQRMVELVATDLESCKTRLIELKDTLIGDGASDNALIHIDVRILSGRTQEQKSALGQAALADIQRCLTAQPTNLQLTVEVSDLDGRNYHKTVLEKWPVHSGQQ